MFDFVGYRALVDACPGCGFQYAIERAEITPWLRADADAFVEKFRGLDEASVRVRPARDVWSPLEYLCHVRDVLRVQKERILLAQHEVDPVFVPSETR